MDNRKLGWIAIGIGVLALLVSLGGRFQMARMQYQSGWAAQQPYQQQWGGPQGPSIQQAPQAPQAPQWSGPQGPRMGMGMGQRFQSSDSFRPFGGPRHGFFLFRIIGGLFRLALLVLIIALVVRWFNRRNKSQPPSSQGPENPPYTGGTQAL